jgi:hypothetical protein
MLLMYLHKFGACMEHGYHAVGSNNFNCSISSLKFIVNSHHYKTYGTYVEYQVPTAVV